MGPDVRVLRKEIWPYQVVLRNESDEPLAWCKEYVGRRFRDWYSYNMSSKSIVYAFRDEHTLLIFKLKWGNYVKD